ncbi:hypothetical protein RRG08_023449 [Elysia crispata]|uniref:Uncharacterized protein n=1 Tax=Elysia crispata TaxID=231223 RepID=A0AAE1DYA5_9GAST|nr:hypothetical protein RRG08_023449 [Elysia crispata]
MDVSQGLITKLVKCKSIKNALTPISSQISLLIIIAEQQDHTMLTNTKKHNLAGSSLVLDVTACAAQLADAVGHLVRAGERQSQMSKEEEFVTQMSLACESLTVACDQLTILAQRFGTSIGRPGGIKDSLCQAAKDVLQGVLKIFLVIDDHYVRQILGKVDFVQRNMTDVIRANKSELVEVFKALTFSVLALKTELKKRCSNLLSKACRDQILVWSGVLQNSVASLSLATQTRLKYQDNLAAKASQESVEHEMKEACQKIRQLLLTGPQDELDDELISFVGLVDIVMESLSELNRSTLSPVVDSNITALVQHSMGVAHLAAGSYRDLVVACCHRILQAKFRLFDLDASLKDGHSQNAIRVDFDNTCETLLDEVCDLERQVNMTVLQLIIHTFLCPDEQLRPLRNIARGRVLQQSESHRESMKKFIQFSDTLCQVSLLVAASCTNNSKIRDIVTSVQLLESIVADVSPAVLLTATDASNQMRVSSNQHLDLLLEWWSREVRTILTSVDAVVDPRVFMDMTESIMDHELERFQHLIGSTREELCACFYHLRHLAQRPAQVARRLQDDSNDAIYRNGLGVFIQLLYQRIDEATETFQDIVMEVPETKSSGGAHFPPSPRQVDTLHRRLSLVKKAVSTLRDGLNIQHHPSLMKRIKLKKEREDHKVRIQEAQLEKMRKRKKDEKNQEGDGLTSTSTLEISTDSKESDEGITTPARLVPLSKVSRESVELVLEFPPEFDDKEKEGGSAAEIYKLVRRLVIASAHQNTRAVEQMTHAVLSWTNHIVENAGMLLAHCSQIAKEGELKSVMKEADQAAPNVIQQAKFVCAGDTQAVYTLTSYASYWASKLNNARVIVDVAADRWLVLTSDLRELTQGHDQHQRKVNVAAIISAQKEMSALLLKTRFLTGSFLQDCPPKIQFLTDSHAEIENLAITIETAVDVASVSDSQSDETWWQLGIACRDWAVMMTCAAAELDSIADIMGALAVLRMPSLEPVMGDMEGNEGVRTGRSEVKGLRLADVVERETNSLLELLDCVVAGDNTLKTHSDSLVYELQAALTDIFAVARQPVTMNKTALHALLCRLRIGLAKSRWIERAMEIQDLISNSCFQYMGFARTLLLDAQDLSIKEESENSIKISEARSRKTVEFLEKSSALKQRTLRAIQLCSELNRRAVVRSTLDSLAKLTTEIGNVMRAPGRIPDAKVCALTQQWGARIKKLLTNLGKMDGVKAGVISEIEKFNRGSESTISGASLSQLSWPENMPGLQSAQENSCQPYSKPKGFEYQQPTQLQHKQPQSYHQAEPQEHYTYKKEQEKNPYQQGYQPHLQEEKQVYEQGYQPQQQQRHQHQAGYTQQPRHRELWQQHLQQTQQPQVDGYYQQYNFQHREHEDPLRSVGNEAVDSTLFDSEEDKQTQHNTNPEQEVLNKVEDLGLHLKRWSADSIRHLWPVQMSLEVAQLCSQMALYARGQGTFKSSLDVVKAAEKMTNLCREVERFGERLLTLTGQGRARDHIQVCLNKIHGCTSQLHIIATAANNSARSHESDRILVRNASNVLSSLKQFFAAVESLAAKRVDAALPNADSYSTTDPLTQQAVELLVTLKAETNRYLIEDRNTGTTDVLGLHRMELHRPPSLASLLDVDVGKVNEEDETSAKEIIENDLKDSKTMASSKPTLLTNLRNPKNINGSPAGKEFMSKVDGTNEQTRLPPKKATSDSNGFIDASVSQHGDEGSCETADSQDSSFSQVTFNGDKAMMLSNKSTETRHPRSLPIKIDQTQMSKDTSASAGSDGVEEEPIEKILSPNSEPDIERLLFKLDEAIEGRWVEPRTESLSSAAPLPEESAIGKQHEDKNKFQRVENIKGKAGIENISGTNNEASQPEDSRFQSDPGPSIHAHNDNLDRQQNQDESSTKNRFYKAKYKAPVKSYKPLKQKNQNRTRNGQSVEGNVYGNQLEDDLDSIIGGASVDSFLLHPEDVFEEPTRGAVQYHSDLETLPTTLTTDPLSSGKIYDSGSEAGLVSAASFLLSHEDVFSEHRETFDTHF